MTARDFLCDAECLARSAARRPSRTERVRRSLSLHGRPCGLSDDRARQPVAVDSYSGSDRATGTIRAGRFLFDRRSALRDRPAQGLLFRPAARHRHAAAALGGPANSRDPGRCHRVYLRIDRHAAALHENLGPARALRARRRTALGVVGRQIARADRHGAGAAHVRLRIHGAAGAGERQCLQRRAAVLSGRYRGSRGARRRSLARW